MKKTHISEIHKEALHLTYAKQAHRDDNNGAFRQSVIAFLEELDIRQHKSEVDIKALKQALKQRR